MISGTVIAVSSFSTPTAAPAADQPTILSAMGQMGTF